MASLNRVILMGNLTRDPEVRYLPSGTAVADLRLAVNRRFRTASGEDRDETCYVNVVVWGKQGQACEKYLQKGAPVLLEGRLRYDEWEKEGQRHSRLCVVAERVQFVGGGRRPDSFDDTSGRTDTSREAAPPAEQGEGGPAAEADGTDMSADDDNLPF